MEIKTQLKILKEGIEYVILSKKDYNTLFNATWGIYSPPYPILYLYV